MRAVCVPAQPRPMAAHPDGFGGSKLIAAALRTSGLVHLASTLASYDGPTVGMRRAGPCNVCWALQAASLHFVCATAQPSDAVCITKRRTMTLSMSVTCASLHCLLVSWSGAFGLTAARSYRACFQSDYLVPLTCFLVRGLLEATRDMREIDDEDAPMQRFGCPSSQELSKVSVAELRYQMTPLCSTRVSQPSLRSEVGALDWVFASYTMRASHGIRAEHE